MDTAPAYGLGHSEEVVGQAIAGRRDQVHVATKCGLVWDDPAERKVFPRLKADSVRAEVEGSLRRLNTDYIDLYQIHWPNPDEDIEEAWTEMAKMVDEGIVRHIGVSNFSPSQVDRVRSIHEVASHQPPYSMLNRSIEAELLPYCAQESIGVVVYSPLQAGLLTGKFTEDLLRPIAYELGVSLAELAVAWTLLRDEVTSAIVGARRPEQIEQVVGGADLSIPSDAQQAIEVVLQG
jgi:aryl-alcohol dehydrogenase-like predicted oxidoreductase